MGHAGLGKRLAPAAGWLIALLVAPAAIAEPVPPAALVPALTVYADSLARGHAAAACAPQDSPARDEAGWSASRAVFVATLWANGYPADFIGATERKLGGAAPTAKPDCTDPMIEADLSAAAVNGWPKEVHRVFGALDLRIVENPVPAERWAKIRTVIADELAAETRELTCLAAVDPAILPVLVHDWDEMIVKLGTTLVAAGIPRPEILAALGNADANALWKPAAADALPALRKSCMDDQAWSDRLATFRSLALGSSVERILAGENP